MGGCTGGTCARRGGGVQVGDGDVCLGGCRWCVGGAAVQHALWVGGYGVFVSGHIFEYKPSSTHTHMHSCIHTPHHMSTYTHTSPAMHTHLTPLCITPTTPPSPTHPPPSSPSHHSPPPNMEPLWIAALGSVQGMRGPLDLPLRGPALEEVLGKHALQQVFGLRPAVNINR